MKEVFKDIQERLKTIPEFRYVGEDWGQLNFEQPPVDWPCALVDLGNAEFSSAGMKSQQVEAVVNITIADIRHQGVFSRLPSDQADKAFEIFDLIDKVNMLLHGTGGEHYSRLCRISLKKMLREDAVREFVMSYKFGYMDETATTVYQKIQVKPEIIVD